MKPIEVKLQVLAKSDSVEKAKIFKKYLKNHDRIMKKHMRRLRVDPEYKAQFPQTDSLKGFT